MSGQVAIGNFEPVFENNPGLGNLPIWNLNAIGAYTIGKILDVTGYDEVQLYFEVESFPNPDQRCGIILCPEMVWDNAGSIARLFVPNVLFDDGPTTSTIPAGLSSAIFAASGYTVSLAGDDQFSRFDGRKLLYRSLLTKATDYYAPGITTINVCGLLLIRIQGPMFVQALWVWCERLGSTGRRIICLIGNQQEQLSTRHHL